MGWIVLLLFYKDGIGIKYHTNVDRLNKETKLENLLVEQDFKLVTLSCFVRTYKLINVFERLMSW